MTTKPSLLVSYYYLDAFLKVRDALDFDTWSMDSGAFTAYTCGKVIDLDAYIATCRDLQARDPQLVEVFSLDVIGDWQASLRNTERMWSAGVEAIPVYHVGEPESALLDMARSYPKIALGGVAAKTKTEKRHWTARCFALVWPHRIHGLAYGDPTSTLTFPFHSVDASTWSLRPAAFGRSQALKSKKQSIHLATRDFRADVAFLQSHADAARDKWAALWASPDVVARVGTTSGPTYRFAVVEGNDAVRAFGRREP